MIETIHELILSLPEDEGAKLLQYVTEHHILGNALLEEYVLREQASILQLKKFDEVKEQFQLDLVYWVDGLEPKLQDLAYALISSVRSHIDMQVEKIVKTNTLMAEAVDKAVEAGKQEIEAKASEVQKAFAEMADKERKRVKMALIETLNAKLDPYIAKAFKASTDRHTAWGFGRDVLVVVVAMGLFYGLKLFM